MNVLVHSTGEFARDAARTVAALLPRKGHLLVTGGESAGALYGELGPIARLAGLDVWFSDERCVPPTDPRSNYGLVVRTLGRALVDARVHRLRGEDDPASAAQDYSTEVAPAVQRGFDLAVLGLGKDGHLAALFPGSAALQETSALCVAVQRPEGIQGLTLTPPALLAANRVVFLALGADHAEAVRLTLEAGESVDERPARLLSNHPRVTFLLDDAAAAKLAPETIRRLRPAAA